MSAAQGELPFIVCDNLKGAGCVTQQAGTYALRSSTFQLDLSHL